MRIFKLQKQRREPEEPQNSLILSNHPSMMLASLHLHGLRK